MAPQITPENAPNPALVFDILQSYQRTWALKAAIELDLFRAVGESGGDLASIAKQCSASERGTRILCDYLTINGLLTKENGRYALTPSRRSCRIQCSSTHSKNWRRLYAPAAR